MLYIKVIDGKTVDHPVFQENLIQVFGEVPPEYQPFYRTTEPPLLKPFEVFDHDAEQYKCVDGVWTDIWPTRMMTAGERALIEAQNRQQFEAYKSELLEKANAELQATTDAHEISVWNLYIEKVTACSFSFGGLNMPAYPRKFNGNPLRMFELGNLTNVGTAPDVIE